MKNIKSAIIKFFKMNRTNLIKTLLTSGMSPVMLKLNQQSAGEEITWQVGWRSVANGFDECLHSIDLNKEVEAQIKNLIAKI